MKNLLIFVVAISLALFVECGKDNGQYKDLYELANYINQDFNPFMIAGSIKIIPENYFVALDGKIDSNYITKGKILLTHDSTEIEYKWHLWYYWEGHETSGGVTRKENGKSKYYYNASMGVCIYHDLDATDLYLQLLHCNCKGEQDSGLNEIKGFRNRTLTTIMTYEKHVCLIL